MISYFNCSDKLEIDKKEVLRYLGYTTLKKSSLEYNIDDYIREFKVLLQPKACYLKLPINISDDIIKIDNKHVKSHSLSVNLKDCSEIYIVAATVGIKLDREIQKLSKLSPSKAIIADALGTAAVEQLCEDLYSKLEDDEQKNNKYLRPRFSPGYGDLNISFQKEIFPLLNCYQNIGLSITDTCLMVPSKSVTAIIGVSDNIMECSYKSCDNCSQIECIYRR